MGEIAADQEIQRLIKRALPGPMDHLGDKADLTPSPLRVSGSHGGGLTGETNDVVRCYGFALTEQASVTLLLPRRNHCSPGKPSRQKPRRENGAERNRTAVRNTGVSHLVGPKADLCSMAPLIDSVTNAGPWASPNHAPSGPCLHGCTGGMGSDGAMHVAPLMARIR